MKAPHRPRPLHATIAAILITAAWATTITHPTPLGWTLAATGTTLALLYLATTPREHP